VTINIRRVEPVTILDLTGSFTAGEATQAFRNSVDEALSPGVTNLAINLAGVPFLDSSAIGLLVRTFLTLKERGGEFRLFGASTQVADTLRVIRLDKVLRVAEDETAALASF